MEVVTRLSMGARFLEVHYLSRLFIEALKKVCVLVKRKCAFSDHVMIKLESLILAQNERWRQA